MPKSKITSRLLLVVLAGLAVLVTVAIIWSMVGLHREVDARTRGYVSDVSTQLAQDIDNRLSKNIADLESIGDSLLRLDSYAPAVLKDYLNRKADSFGFTSFVITDLEGGAYQSASAVERVFSLPGVRAALKGENSVSFLEGQGILYSIPLYQEETVIGTLSGLRNKENMQALIRMDSFSGKSLTCITDCDGDVIISPTDVTPFMQLDSIFTENPESEEAQRIYQMEEDMIEHRTGAFRFQAVDGADLLLAYNPLHSYDWVLLTLVSSDVISKGMDQYLSQIIVVIAVTLVLMGCILFFLFLGQQSHFRQIKKAAFEDRVTGGMNNAAFQLRCEELLPKAPPNTYSVVLLNIKNFKLINEQFGIEQSNRLLKHFMQILRTEVQGKGFAARAEADNFFLCLEESSAEEILRTVDAAIQRLGEDVRKFNEGRDTPYLIVLQPGVYIVDDPALKITIIQDRARTACRDRTAAEDGVCKFYNMSVMERWKKDQELTGLFAGSLENRDFQVYLQPKVWTESGKAGGAEALVRWVHPQKGMIFPSDFIPLFESNGSICELDLYVFEEVCRTLRRWQDDGRPLFPISVNLSRQHFQRPGCLEPFASLARQYRILEGILELELTESIFFDDQGIEEVKAHIQEMHRLGFRCSLDDFGSGFSSLGLLTEFDVDAIKLDRRFFKDIGNPKVRDVIASVVDLSRKIGAITVAEGIETEEQAAFMREVSCDLIQGYFYSRPLPIPDFEEWLREREVERH